MDNIEDFEVEVLEKPTYICSFYNCGKRYANRTSLRRHVRNVHEKHRFQCEGCGKFFTTNRQRVLHAVKHKTIDIAEDQVFIT